MARMPVAVLAMTMLGAVGCTVAPQTSISLSYAPPAELTSPTGDEQAACLAAHREGWEECLDRFLHPEPEHLASSHLVEDQRLDPADQSAHPEPRDESPAVAHARADGFEQCRLALLALSSAHGEDNVRFALDARRD